MDTIEPNTTLSLLIVDDEPDARAVMVRLLSLSGYRVTTAGDGNQACELFARQHFDCVLLDVEMPGIDGFETARRIRQLQRSGGDWVPIIMVTGMAGEQSLVQGIDAGADDYLVKPVSHSVLIAKIQAMRRLATAQNRLRQSNQQLQRLALLDGLTGLANRRRFDDFLGREWQRHRRYGRLLSLLLIDVDYFKLYNDYYGHQQGDRCLCTVANVLRQQTRRATDLVARYGGEEFAVIMAETGPEAAFRAGAELCRNVVLAQIDHSPRAPLPFVTVSIGVASTLPRPSQNASVLTERCDKALYAAKAQGRNRAVLAEGLEASATVLD